MFCSRSLSRLRHCPIFAAWHPWTFLLECELQGAGLPLQLTVCSAHHRAWQLAPVADIRKAGAHVHPPGPKPVPEHSNHAWHWWDPQHAGHRSQCSHTSISLSPCNNPREYTLLFSSLQRRRLRWKSSSNVLSHAALRWQSQNLRPGQVTPGFVSLTIRLYCLSLAKQKKYAFLGHQSQIMWLQEAVHSLLGWVRAGGRLEGPKPHRMQTRWNCYSPDRPGL